MVSLLYHLKKTQAFNFQTNRPLCHLLALEVLVMNNMEINICPFCGEGHLIRSKKDVEYTYKGAKLLIAQPGLHCNKCEESILEPQDMASNRVDLQAFRARIDGLLEPMHQKAGQPQSTASGCCRDCSRKIGMSSLSCCPSASICKTWL